MSKWFYIDPSGNSTNWPEGALPKHSDIQSAVFLRQFASAIKESYAVGSLLVRCRSEYGVTLPQADNWEAYESFPGMPYPSFFFGEIARGQPVVECVRVLQEFLSSTVYLFRDWNNWSEPLTTERAAELLGKPGLFRRMVNGSTLYGMIEAGDDYNGHLFEDLRSAMAALTIGGIVYASATHSPVAARRNPTAIPYGTTTATNPTPYTAMLSVNGGVVDDDVSINGEVYEAGEYAPPGQTLNGQHAIKNADTTLPEVWGSVVTGFIDNYGQQRAGQIFLLPHWDRSQFDYP